MDVRKYRVRGQDADGDIHIFLSDDRERAEDVRGMMAEDLDRVELVKCDEANGKEHEPQAG
ncbi:hypothetical protein [Sphingosinicella sp. BN140058]|uniref:hypothetical protein n=1 Tax=Sphingosinicella sp. BN140058 TaxID=1892855 RepID=UPI001010099B|nr:hypothetical protein [Sphingosinicella sp. BN140058]QAY80375.1 hypothetical protein ETR14_27430 [Sphingosinicella sp. BN140058]